MLLIRICGNSAYVLGTTVEFERGLQEFLTIFSDQQTMKSIDMVKTLSQLLVHTDTDCVLNATGTLGTLVRRFLLIFI